MTCNYSSEEYMGTDSLELCGLDPEKQSVMLYMETWSIDATFDTPRLGVSKVPVSFHGIHVFVDLFKY